MAKLKLWKAILPDGEKVSAEGMLKWLTRPINQIMTDRVKEEYVIVATSVPPEWDDLEPGSIVITEWNGLRAKWMNGNVYVSRYAYERYKADQQYKEELNQAKERARRRR